MSGSMTSEEQTFVQLRADGWQEIATSVGFTGHVGPYWRKDDGQGRIMGLVVGERHANVHLGSLHGGVVMSFADIALGSGVVAALGEKAFNCVTLSLNTQFVAIAKVGEFVTLRPEVVRQTRQLVFVRGLMTVGDRTIAACEGIWKVLDGELRRA